MSMLSRVVFTTSLSAGSPENNPERIDSQQMMNENQPVSFKKRPVGFLLFTKRLNLLYFGYRKQINNSIKQTCMVMGGQYEGAH